MKSLLLFTCLLPLAGLAQKNKNPEDKYYLFDTAWKPCKERNAAYVARVQYIDDTTWQWNYYHLSGPLVSIESFRDEKGETPNGYCAWFDAKGQIDSSGYSINGKKHGDWYTYNDALAVTWIRQYDNGHFIKEGTNKDLYPKTPPAPGDTDATFQGGMDEWKKYLQKNYRYPARSIKSKISGTVQVLFTIDTTGQVTRPRLLRSVEVTMDTEVLRVIGSSPKWIPAVKNGYKVNAYRKQPFNSIIAN